MKIKTQLNHLHIAPRKVRLVADMIRGKDARRAELILEVMLKRASAPLLKLLRSGLANAAHNFQLNQQVFYVREIRVDPGPVARKFRARAFGRAAPIRRRTSHVALILETKEGSDILPREERKKPELSLRTATPNDVIRTGTRHRREEKSSVLAATKPKTSGAFRRIFQRKVI